MRAPLLLVFISFLIYFGHSQNITYPCTLPNDCTHAPVGYSICFEGFCRQCNPTASHKDCSCEPSEYCVVDPSSVISVVQMSHFQIYNKNNLG